VNAVLWKRFPVRLPARWTARRCAGAVVLGDGAGATEQPRAGSGAPLPRDHSPASRDLFGARHRGRLAARS